VIYFCSITLILCEIYANLLIVPEKRHQKVEERKDAGMEMGDKTKRL
jgi:hypothetical protein